MGGALGVCPNRKVFTSSVPAAQCFSPEDIPRKAVSTETKVKTSQRESAAVAPPLPTKSWRALLQEPTLNPDAKPFHPAQAVPHRPGVAGSSPVGLSAGKDVEPEWMQYLGQKLSGPTSSPLAGTKDVSKLSAVSARNRSRHGASASEAGVLGEGPTASIVIHTDTYLKLLKEGPAKTKDKKPQARTLNGVRPVLSQAPQMNTVNRAVNRASLVAGRSFTKSLEADHPMQITTSNLVRKWSTALNRPQGTEVIVEEALETREIQDDIKVERVLIDENLSEPAYWSETESASVRSASAHRLCRRPHLSAAMIRSYVMQDLSFDLDQAVGKLLLRLQRFTDHCRTFYANSSDDGGGGTGAQIQQRRFVIGLKEVARRTKQSKVAALIVAPDIEEDANSGGLDDRMRELLASAYQNQTPVIFALSRARLGKALGKSLNISVLGVLDAVGAQDLLAESVRLANECRQAWLARLGDTSK